MWLLWSKFSGVVKIIQRRAGVEFYAQISSLSRDRGRRNGEYLGWTKGSTFFSPYLLAWNRAEIRNSFFCNSSKLTKMLSLRWSGKNSIFSSTATILNITSGRKERRRQECNSWDRTGQWTPTIIYFAMYQCVIFLIGLVVVLELNLLIYFAPPAKLLFFSRSSWLTIGSEKETWEGEETDFLISEYSSSRSFRRVSTKRYNYRFSDDSSEYEESVSMRPIHRRTTFQPKKDGKRKKRLN